MGKKMSLGRGLDSLFSDNAIVENTASGVQTIRISQIEPKPDQPRTVFEEEPLGELADSIREHGVIQPILVREKENGYYEIIAGERRWRASHMLGLNDIPAIVIQADDFKAAQISLIENLQRENLNPLEEAFAYKTLMDEFKLTQEDLAVKVGKSRSAIANALRLSDLPQPVLDLITSGKLSAGHGRAILSVGSEYQMIALANEAVAKGWSVRQTEAQAKKAHRKNKIPAMMPVMDVPNYLLDLEHRATELTGRVVKISSKRKKVIIEYQDNEDLSALLSKLCGEEINR